MSRAVLHVSPHPDDELIGAPATLMALRDAGHDIVNLALGLGRPADAARRRDEAREAAERAGFELIVAEPPMRISRDDDLAAAESAIRTLLREHLEDRAPAIVVSPSPHDRHHGHEVVARALREALRELPEPPSWWMWGLWGALPFPTLFVPFDDDRREEIEHALEAHAGEVHRNDWRRLIGARGSANAVLGSELVFGFGAQVRPAPYAELLTEVARHDGAWWFGAPRQLDPAEPHLPASDRRADAWVDAPSPATLLEGPTTRP